MARRKLRRWAWIVMAALVAVEVAYVVAANLMLRTGLLADLINRKPEKRLIQWTSASTYLPGVVHVEGFSMRAQSRKVQWFVALEEADAVISLLKLPFKTLHVRDLNGQVVDFRIRRRLDARPSESTEDLDPPGPPPGADDFPEIPGLDNPPDPKPEDLYPPRSKSGRSPWTIRLGGVDIDGPIRVAVNSMRLEGAGAVGGGMTFKLRRSIRVRRVELRLESSQLRVGPSVLSDNLGIDVTAGLEPFPPKGTKLPEIIGGATGTISIRGDFAEHAAVAHQITPGLTVMGTGSVDAELRLKRGVLQPGSAHSVRSDTLRVGIMALEAVGSAAIIGATEKVNGVPATRTVIEFSDYQLLDPSDQSVGVAGTGLEIQIAWDRLSLAGGVQPTMVDLTLPRTEIRDVSVVGALLPPQENVAIRSGSGTVEGHLAVDGSGIAVGRVQLEADDITVDSRGKPLRADLDVDARLAEGSLDSRRFDLSGTTIGIDDVVDKALSDKQQQKLEPWYAHLELASGTVIFGKPSTAQGRVRVQMHDSRPLVALIKEFTKPPGWLSLMPNVKDIDGTMVVDIDGVHAWVDDLSITGKSMEALGWLRISGGRSNGRLFVKYGALAAGVSIDDSKGKIHLAKPRKWFEEQQPP